MMREMQIREMTNVTPQDVFSVMLRLVFNLSGESIETPIVQHYLGDLWHDALRLSAVWRDVEQRNRDIWKRYRIVWVARECGTHMITDCNTSADVELLSVLQTWPKSRVFAFDIRGSDIAGLLRCEVLELFREE